MSVLRDSFLVLAHIIFSMRGNDCEVWVVYACTAIFVEPSLMLYRFMLMACQKSVLQYLRISVMNIQITIVTTLRHFKLPSHSAVMDT